MAELTSIIYAESLLDVTEELGTTEKVKAELDELNALFKDNEDLYHFYTSPKINKEKKKETLKGILESQLSLRLDRVWNARSVSPTIATDPMELKEPSDSSNSLLALDGEISNLSGISMEVSTMLRATLRINDISYSCTVQCEKDKGAAFGTTLLPMGKSRLVILCEIPEGLELTSVELDMDVAVDSKQYSLYYLT